MISWQRGAAVAVVTVFAGSIPLFGPVPALTMVPALVALVAMVRYPVVAVLIPLVVAPVAFTPIPGAAGLRVIHVAVATAVGGVALGYFTRRLSVRPPAVLGWAAAFVACFAVGTMTSVDPAQSLRSSLNHLLGLALAASAAVVVRQTPANLTWVLRGWVVAASVVVVPALPAALTATDRFAGALIEGRVQGVFSQPNDFGEFGMFAVVMAWALFAGSTTATDRTLAIVGGVVGAAGVAVSFSRGTWMGLVAVVVVAVVLAPRLLGPVVVVLTTSLPVALLGVVTGTPPFTALSGRLAAMVSGPQNPEDDRSVIHEQAWRLFLDNPVTGTGPGTFPSGAFEPGAELVRRPYLHAHSALLTGASELGIVGVLGLLGFTVALGFVVLRTRRVLLSSGRFSAEPESSRVAILAAGLMGVAVHGLVDFVYTNPYLIPLAWFQAGLVAGLCAGFADRWTGVPDRSRDRVCVP